MTPIVCTNWYGFGAKGERPHGIHPSASIGGPPESRDWKIGDPNYPPVIAESALIHAFCTIDSGLTRPTQIGERSFLMARVHVAHDAVIGDDCELGAGVVLCGHVEVGLHVRIGGNAWVRPFITIGDGAVIGGGSVVVKDIPPGETHAGNPARRLGATYDDDWLRWWNESRARPALDAHDLKYGIDELPKGGC